MKQEQNYRRAIHQVCLGQSVAKILFILVVCAYACYVDYICCTKTMGKEIIRKKTARNSVVLLQFNYLLLGKMKILVIMGMNIAYIFL